MSVVPISEHRPQGLIASMASTYNVDASTFESTVRNLCLPPDQKTGRHATKEEFAAFLLVAHKYKLNPMLRQIYGIRTKAGNLMPVVGVDGWADLCNQHPAFDGMEFVDQVDRNGNVTAIECRIYRKDRARPICATEYLAECKMGTDPWSKWPRRMLRHKAMIQAARYAFSFSGIYDPDEVQRMTAEPVPDHRPTIDVVADAPPPALEGPTSDEIQTAADDLAEAATRGGDALAAQWANTPKAIKPILKRRLDTEWKPAAKDADAAAQPDAAHAAPQGDDFPGDRT